MALKTNAEKIRQGYINACNAVLGRGGSIASGAPIGDLAEAIINIPHDTTLAYHEVNSTAYRSIVPSNAENRALVNKIGGKSYKTRQLIPYPYAEKNKTVNGITFTDNGDGTVTVNGTATANATLWLYAGVKLGRLIAGGTYAPSIGNSAIGSSVILMCNYEADGVQKNFTTSQIGARTYPSNATKDLLYLLVQNGTTVNNVTVKPMLNEGETALPYEPYFEGLRDTKTTALVSEGQNILPYPFKETTRTANGITFTDHGNGTMTVNGTATGGTAVFALYSNSNNVLFEKGKTYTISDGTSNPTIGGYYVYMSAVADGTTTTLFGTHSATTRTFTNNYSTITGIACFVVIKEGTTVNNLTVYPQIQIGITATEYKPCVGTIETLAIPEAVQSIEGYGLGVNENYFNYIDFERKVFKGPCRRFLIDGSKGSFLTTSLFGNVWLIYVSTLGYGDGIFWGIADKYHSLSYDEIHAGKEGIYFANTSEIYIVDSRFTDAATAKAILSESPVECVCAFDTEIETDISEYLTGEFIKVEGGGTITAVNENEEGVPTSVTYLIETVGG